MSLERAPLESCINANPDWFAPLAAFIAWLSHLFEQIAKLKRIRQTTHFKPNWRDVWPKLRQCEWLRDQMLAAGAAQLLAGKPLDLDNFTPSTEPPADFGGRCPATPFEMNRRVLAFARWNADPETAIREHAARITRNNSGCPLRHDSSHRATSPGSADGGKEHRSLSSSGASRRGRWIARACGLM